MSDRSFKRYLDVCESVGAEFERNRRLYGERIRCRRGCTDCCHHIFQITEVEAAYISRYVKQLPAEEREKLVEKARTYLPAREAILSEHGVIEAWGGLPKPGTRLACPALMDGACAIYEHRPLICRKFGMPLYSPQKPEQVFACQLNFREGEEIHDRQLVEIQTGIYNESKSLQEDYNRAGGRRDPHPISVARAIVEDFESYLPQ